MPITGAISHKHKQASKQNGGRPALPLSVPLFLQLLFKVLLYLD